jgi:hypothetical protein
MRVFMDRRLSAERKCLCGSRNVNIAQQHRMMVQRNAEADQAPRTIVGGREHLTTCDLSLWLILLLIKIWTLRRPRTWGNFQSHRPFCLLVKLRHVMENSDTSAAGCPLHDIQLYSRDNEMSRSSYTYILYQLIIVFLAVWILNNSHTVSITFALYPVMWESFWSNSALTSVCIAFVSYIISSKRTLMHAFN